MSDPRGPRQGSGCDGRDTSGASGKAHLQLGVGHTPHVGGGDGGADEALARVVPVTVHHTTLQVTARRADAVAPTSRR